MRASDPIERVYVATWRGDLRFARICVASIRYWYADIPISLIKDESRGPFSTRELETCWGVQVLDGARRRFGWGFGKLEPLFQEGSERFLILDADTVFAGPLLEDLARHDADMVVDQETQSSERLQQIYFDLANLRLLDPQFVYPGFTFNTGQWVARSGLFQRKDFEPFLEWEPEVRLKHPEVFKNGEQGLLNYLVLKRASEGLLRLARTRLLVWDADDAKRLDLTLIRKDSPYRAVIHWVGPKPASLSGLMRSDILRFFEDRYYARVAMGKIKRLVRRLGIENGARIRRFFSAAKRVMKNAGADRAQLSAVA